MAGINTFDELSAVKGFKIAHLNVRSIVKKIDQLRVLLHDSSVDIITFSETWLKPHIHSDILKLEGYDLYRDDRTYTGRSKEKGKKRGGWSSYICQK